MSMRLVIAPREVTRLAVFLSYLHTLKIINSPLGLHCTIIRDYCIQTWALSMSHLGLGGGLAICSVLHVLLKRTSWDYIKS